MGGNALSSPSVRLTKKNYDRVSAECVAKLQELYPHQRVAALGSYHCKADFGDCDILVESSADYDPQLAAAALGAVEVSRNGPVTSVGILVRPEVLSHAGNMFQVDLIKTAPESFEFAQNYFGHGDTGNLLGRIAHSQGVSLRHDGLVYFFRDGDYKFREILLTLDFRKALAFMGYDPHGLDNGFETPQDIYNFVTQTPFFNPDVYLLENRNAVSRVRDKKRVMYMEFLQHCAKETGGTRYQFPENKAAWHPRLTEHFPHFKVEYDQAVADLAEQRAIKDKFNGAWVSELTGLEGKELGMLMKRFKDSFESPEAQKAFVLENSPEVLASRVKILQVGLHD